MNRQALRIFVFALCVVSAGLATRHFLVNPALQAPAMSTKALFAAQLPDAHGQPQSLQQWKGKIAIVNFWASWCIPCREEMPELSKLQTRYEAKNVVVLGISTDDLDKMRAFSKDVPVSYPLLAGDYQAIQLAEQLGNDKGVLPYTLIVDANGHIEKTYFGRVNQALLEQTLIPMLGKR